MFSQKEKIQEENLFNNVIKISKKPIPTVAILPFHISACGVNPLFQRFNSALSTRFLVSCSRLLTFLFIVVIKMVVFWNKVS